MTEQEKAPETAQKPFALDRHALFAALAKAQGEFKAIEKNREVQIQMRSGGSFKFRYADLEEIISKTRPALAANGLSLFQTLDTAADGALLCCVLAHSSGASVRSEHKLPKNLDADPKTFGATISYFRRYLVTALLGVAADDDLDEDGQEADEQRGHMQAAARSKPAAQNNDAALLTQEEQANITAIAEEVGASIKDICSACKVGSLGFIKRSAYSAIIKRLEAKRGDQ